MFSLALTIIVNVLRSYQNFSEFIIRQFHSSLSMFVVLIDKSSKYVFSFDWQVIAIISYLEDFPLIG